MSRSVEMYVSEEQDDMEWAAMHNRVDIVARFFRKGAHPMSSRSIRALLTAAEAGSTEVVKFFVEQGADPRQGGDAFALRAAEYGHHDLVHYLLAHGASSDDVLCTAAEYGHYTIVMTCLHQGADVHFREDYALRWAAREGHVSVVSLLLDCGANVHARDDYALVEAAKKGHVETVRLLLKAGADVHARGGIVSRVGSPHAVDILKMWTVADADGRTRMAEGWDWRV